MPAMRLLIYLLLLLALVGCGSSQGTLAATPLSQPTIPAVAEGLDRPPKGTFEVIGYLYSTAAGAALVGGLSFSHGSIPTPLPEAGAIWLPAPVALPTATPLEQVGSVRYLIVRATGTLSPPGSYGPGGAYPYQLADVTLAPLSLRELSIPLLLDNSGIYDNQPVHITGQLLFSQSTALLVERLGSGGVPESSARQIKLLGPVEHGPLLDRLTATASGNAHFGPVQVVGIWRRSALYILAIIPS